MDFACKSRCGFVFLGLLLLAGCSLRTTAPPLDSTAVQAVATAIIVTSTPDSGWNPIAPGLERRTYGDNPLSQLVVVRFDLARYVFRTHYQPGNLLNTQRWTEQLSGSVAFVNANFFDVDNRITGLLVADGVVYGAAYTDRGGMFAVQNGVPRVRSNTREPYAGERLEQAVQAFPMLVLDGQSVYTNPEATRVTRRTVVGQDAQGRVLLMATPLIGQSLVELSAFLANSDMGLVNAFNLDGGGSTMMVLNGEAVVQSLDPVPAVLAVYAR
jgi:exopolysaccharide biosynthesis protein